MLAVLLVLACSLWAKAQAAELFMFERPGCPYCIRWNKEIRPIYVSSAEGRRAPLKIVDLRNGMPAGIVFAAPVRYTPTFVLVDKGRETGRITGYFDNATFWGMLEKLILAIPGR